MKRVLIIAYYWPPSGGSGVQRWLNFSKFLPDYDWQPVVYTPENPDFNIKDEALLSEVNPNVEIVKTKIWEPYGLHRNLLGKQSDEKKTAGVVDSKKGLKSYLSNWLRGNLFIPDPKVFWRKPSVKFLKQYLTDHPVDAIISTGTPHSMHLIAMDLKKEYPNIPWIADFRDPWSELDMLNSYHILPARFKKYQRLEAQVLKSADLALTTSQVWAKDFERLGAARAECITNGYNQADFDNKVEPYKEFVISHFGLINHLRNPQQLWQALEELCEENEGFSNDFKLHLGGTIAPEILDSIESFPKLKSKLKVFPYLSHIEVIKEYQKSALLLLLLFNSESGIGNIPGKLFEYLAARKPILAFGPGEGDSAKIVKETEQAEFFLYGQQGVKEIKSFVKSSWEEFKAGTKHLEQKHFLKYERSQLTKRLSELLNQLIS